MKGANDADGHLLFSYQSSLKAQANISKGILFPLSMFACAFTHESLHSNRYRINRITNSTIRRK